jgi:hypothetical protein
VAPVAFGTIEHNRAEHDTQKSRNDLAKPERVTRSRLKQSEHASLRAWCAVLQRSLFRDDESHTMRRLVLDSANGILSGTPSEARGVAPYTITASSVAGNTRFVLLLTVMPAPSAIPPNHRAGPGGHAERTSKRANRL